MATPAFQRNESESLVNSPVSFSVAIAARLLNAGVQPMTVHTVLLIASGFNLSVEGETKIHNALSTLKFSKSLGKMVWFGFGVEHIIHTLADTTHGAACIALCGCLSEAFTLEAAAVILSGFAQHRLEPQAPGPSLPQWMALLDTCSGVLASTNFGKVSEFFMSLNKDSSVVPCGSINQRPDHTPDRKMGEPTDVAAVLDALGRLSMAPGDLRSITITGGSVCGWIAAVAHWFLGFAVEIYHGEEWPSLFRRSDDSPVRLTVRYIKSGIVPHIGDSTYIVRDTTEVIYADSYLCDTPTGRVGWDKAIRATFGQAGQKLLQNGYLMGKLMGHIARAFTSYAQADPEIRKVHENPFKITQNWIGYRWSSYGKGYIEFATKQLPELGPMRLTMEESLSGSYLDAVVGATAARDGLATLCSCTKCSGTLETTNQSSSEFCLPDLAEAIVLLTWALSLTSLDEKKMEPNRAGLESFYHHHARPLGHCPPDRHSIGRLLGYLNVSQLFTTAECIFAGGLSGGSPQPNPTRLAYVSGCVCMYLHVLEEVSDETRDPILHVIPGGMRLRSGRKCISLDEGPRALPDWQINRSNHGNNLRLRHAKTALAFILDTNPTTSTCPTASLLVTETGNEPQVRVSFTSSWGTCTVGPRYLLSTILRATGMVYCPKLVLGNCEDSPPPEEMVSVDGEERLSADDDIKAGNDIIIRRIHGGMLERRLSRCLASLIQPCKRDIESNQDQGTTLMPTHAVILGERGCEHCCSRAVMDALKNDSRPVYFIQKKMV